MRVKPSGIILVAECEVQTECCVAKTPTAITAVWVLPSRTQTNVCRECLEEMVRSGEWEIESARVEPRADIAVLDANNNMILAIEVKRHPTVALDVAEWAIRIHRNLLAHGALPRAKRFLLAICPEPFFLWDAETTLDPNAKPSEVIMDAAAVDRFLTTQESTPDERRYEEAVARWLDNALFGSAPLSWVQTSGLDAELEGARIVREGASQPT